MVIMLAPRFAPTLQKEAKCDQCSSFNVDCIQREEMDRFLERNRKYQGPSQITTVKISKTYICAECKNTFQIIDYYQLTRSVLDEFDIEDQEIRINRQNIIWTER